jgi:hypothetical protein
LIILELEKKNKLLIDNLNEKKQSSTSKQIIEDGHINENEEEIIIEIIKN